MADEHDPPPPDDAPEGDKKRLFERAIPQLIKRLLERAVESGVEKLQEGPENLRALIDDLKLPKEALHYLYTQIDDTKNGLYRVVAKEMRDVLENTQFADEITKVLTRLSFEIKTEIRFVPNRAKSRDSEDESSDDDDMPSTGLPKPEVKAQVSVKDRSKETRRDRRRREDS